VIRAPRTTDTEGRPRPTPPRVGDGGTCTVAADAGGAPRAVPPRAWFVAFRVQFAAGGGADRPYR
jgi:hypothetical protein